jgi:anti-sigma-K factor RskA
MKYFPPDRYSLSIHRDARQDLEQLYATDKDGAATIVTFLQEVAASQNMLENLSIRNHRSYVTPEFDVKRWEALWKSYGLWRLRLFNVPGVAASSRIIYALHPIERRYYVLGIVPREFDYEPSHPLSQRIINTYKDLDLPP